MHAAAKEEMFAVLYAPPMTRTDEEIFFLAALSSAAPEMPIGAKRLEGKKPHQGIFSKNRTIAVGAMWAKWSGTHQVSGRSWRETVLGPTVYGYDGHGSVRQLTNSTGAVTDTYDYDAFGNLINSTGSTPNVYLFAGEAYDSALGLYYNRARYLNSTTGRFWSMDTYEGDAETPLSLHKYIYTNADPVDGTDPSGFQDSIGELGAEESMSMTLDAMPQLNYQAVVGGVKSAIRDDPKDLWLVPDMDIHRPGKKAGIVSAAVAPERHIHYELERKDGAPLHNPDYNWTVSEHQTEPGLAGGPYGTSSSPMSGEFCDDISPQVGSRLPLTSNQTFTISPQPGAYNPNNENHDVVVHTDNGDFGTLAIYMDWNAIYVNGLTKWKGTADVSCSGQL
jgi:RHS repeat-associated protein